MYLQTYGKAEKLVVFVGFLKGNDEKLKTAGYGSGSESIGRRHGSAQICTKMSRIHHESTILQYRPNRRRSRGILECEAFGKGGKEREGNEGKGNRGRGRKRKNGGILMCLLLASLRFFLARKESEASSLVRRLLRLFISAEQPLINSSWEKEWT
jgi:hypothetical protein